MIGDDFTICFDIAALVRASNPIPADILSGRITPAETTVLHKDGPQPSASR